MGKWHWEGYRKNPHVQFVGFSDTDIKRAQAFAVKTPAKVYANYRQMIQEQKLNGVSVCTVPSTHKQIVLDLLAASVNVLCEKPLATTVSDAEEMTRSAKESGRLLLTAFKFRFFNEVREAKAILDKEMLGRILNFRLMFGGHIDMACVGPLAEDVEDPSLYACWRVFGHAKALRNPISGLKTDSFNILG